MSAFSHKLIFILASIFNALFIYTFVFLIGELNKHGLILSKDVVLMSMSLISIQSGQSIAVQFGIGGKPVNSVTILLLGAIISFLLYKIMGNDIFWIGMLFSTLGYAYSVGLTTLLTPSLKWKYHFKHALRGFIICSIYLLFIYLKISLYKALILVWFLFSIYIIIDCNVRINERFEELKGVFLVLCGIIASAIYRNDITFVRDSYAKSDDFYFVSQALVFYSFIVSVVGFYVVNFIYAKINVNKDLIKVIYSKKIMRLCFLVAIITCLGGFFLESIFFYYILLVIPSSINSFLSSYHHSVSKSVFVYISGLLTISCAYFVYDKYGGSISIDHVFGIYLFVLGFVLYLKFEFDGYCR